MFALVSGLPSIGPRPALAQDIQRIAAVVNDEIVSTQDLRERVQMVVVTSGLPNSPEVAQRLAPQVLRTLIDEQLQLQEAARLNISVSEEDLAQARSVVEQRNNLRPGQLDPFLRSLGIEPSTVERQQRANIGWGASVRRRYGNDVAVSQEEVEDELARIAEQVGKTQKRVFEILLTVDNPADEVRTRELAERLVREVRAGAPLDSVARQFSQASSATNGGDIGWIIPDTMGEEVAPVVASLEKGKVSDPIRTVFGYQILAVADTRVIEAAAPGQAKLDLKQVFLPIPRDASADARSAQFALAEAVSATARDCADMTSLAEEVQSPVDPNFGETTLAELPDAMRTMVAGLEVGQTTQPIELPNGVMVLMLCEREATGSTQAEAEQVRRQLENRRFEILAQRYLRDLRRNAFVDVRV
ncbi:MAG: peptidylprolyl isomerase [Alphaproteobacteria bacterium]|nr:peptidylprolyl isomerase [Alphaproteobacteria bacterium]